MAHYDCDVLIIGAGIGGLTTGALLAHKGKKVVILEQAAQAGGRLAAFEADDYIFEATSCLYNGFELGGGHERIMAELGLLLTKQNLNPVWQVVLPNHRVSVYNERVAFGEELKREFPEHSEEIRNFLHKLDEIESGFFELYKHKNFIVPNSLKEKYVFHREIQQKLNRLSGGGAAKGLSLCRQFVDNEEFIRLLDLPVFFYSLHPLESCPLLLAAYILGVPKRGAVYFPGGSQRLNKNLIKSLTGSGGEIKYNSRVTQVIVEHGQAAGVRLENGEMLRARDIVANTTLAALYNNLLPEKSVPAKARKKLHSLPAQWAPFSVYLGVEEDVLPEKMQENLFLCTDYSKPHGGTHNLHINVSPANDIDRAPKGKRALTVTTYLPYAEWRRLSDPRREEQTVGEIIDNLRSLVNFIDEGIACRLTQSAPAYRKVLIPPSGPLSGLAGTPSGFGFDGYSSYTHLKRLWIVGEDTFPGRGSDFVSLCAYNLANTIANN